MADKQATFAVRVPVDTNAQGAANAVDSLRASISASQDRVKGLQGNLRLLRGASDEVTAAKTRLKATIEAERNAISGNVLALDKLGASAVAVKAKTTGLAESLSKVDKAAGTLGGPVSDVTSKLAEYGKVLETAVANPELAAAAGAVALTAGVVALAAGLVYGAAKLAIFTFETANAMRTMGLYREAALGSEENSRRFGNQIEALRAKIPTTREELNKLSVDLSRNLAQARVSGAGIVDTFSAVAQESAAMGDGAGKQIEDIITRMKRLGRIGIGRFELQGTGIEFKDVAAALAKNTGKSIAVASAELRTGRAKLDDGAKAIKDAIEKRFGAINTKRMLDFDVIVTKTKERLQGLTKDVNLEPILAGIDRLSQMFDVNTVTGQGLKTIIDSIAKTLSAGFEGALPTIIEYFQRGVLLSLQIETVVLAVAVGFKGWISHIDNFDAKLQKVIDGLKTAAVIAGGLLPGGIGTIVQAVNAKSKLSSEAAKNGNATAQGFVAGIAANDNAVSKAADNMAKTAVDATRDKLKIHSPSIVFRGMGRDTARGYAEGVEDESPRAARATSGLGSTAPTTPASAKGKGSKGFSGEVHIHLHFDKDASPTQMVAAVSSADFRAALTKAIEDMATGEGSPIAEVA